MKKYLLLLMAISISLAIVGCVSPDEPLGPEIPNVENITITPEQMTIDAEGGEFSVDIQTQYEYQAVSNVDWIEIKGSINRTQSRTLYFVVKPNDTTSPREGNIIVSCDDYNLSAILTILQEAGEDKSIPLNEIWYTATEKVTPYKTDVFGATIVSNEWDETTSKGVITFDGNVTSIGDWAFNKCSSLTSVTIPDSVTSIGSYALYGCTSLTSITIPNSVTEIESCAFSECSSLKVFYGKFASADNRCLIVDGVLTSFAPAGLTEYSIPDSVTSIGECAFAECFDLTSVTIPNSVTSIGSYAFSRCSLTSITIPDSVTSFGNLAFSECLCMTSFYGKFASEDNCCLIVDGVLYSFAVSCDLTEYTIPNGVTEIGKKAFYSGYFLTNVTIPDSVTLIENSAFFNCISLTSVTIPDSVTSIRNAAFRKCRSLTSVTIGNSVTSIGDSVFSECSNLASVTIGNNVSSIGKNAFNSCSSLTSITIPNSVASIGGYAFSSCSSLTSVTISNSITSIEEYTFRGCSSLTSFTIPDNVTSIGKEAFSGCSSLTSITIPYGVTSIRQEAFNKCSSLMYVYCKPTTPPKGGSNMFNSNASGRKIYVPTASVETYKSASYWIDYKSSIFGYDF